MEIKRQIPIRFTVRKMQVNTLSKRNIQVKNMQVVVMNDKNDDLYLAVRLIAKRVEKKEHSQTQIHKLLMLNMGNAEYEKGTDTRTRGGRQK